MDRPVFDQTPVTPFGLPIQIADVHHDYKLDGGELHILNGISISIEAGTFVSILGPSGCGKSTLLRLIAGLEQPTAGHISAGGHTVDGPGPERILAFQDATLFPWSTVWKNVATGLAARGELKGQEHRVDAIIEKVRLSKFARALPHQLSGGMAQRAALARALVNNPPVLLLDEPLGKLDSFTRMAMQDELFELWRAGRFTGVMVTHDIEEALLLSDKIFLLSDRPARIIEEISIDLPRPRSRDDPAIIALRKHATTVFGLGHHSEPQNVRPS